MGAITPQFLFDLESNMRTISAQEYQRLTQNLTWNQIAKQMTSGAKKERITWLLDTAMIEPAGKGGNIEFNDILSNTMELEHVNANAGLKVKKEQLEDLDGNGIDLASHWARQMGAYAAYWPQKSLYKAILANPTTYDGQSFFSTAHPTNGLDTTKGTFANVFTGAASGIYPGALKFDNSVSLEVAVQNIAKAIAYMASLKMPNGEDPRFLRLSKIFCPPAMTARVQQITNAKFIAQAAGSAAGTGDVEAVIRNFGLGQPVEVAEIGSAFTGGSDTSVYFGVESIQSDQLGAWIYSLREPFSIVYHGPQTSAELARIREFQWTTEGRNVITPGHPYLMFRSDAT